MLSVVALVGTAGAACFFCRARVSAREGWEGWKRRVKGPREVRGVARTWPRQWGVQARGVAWRGRRMGEGLPVMVLTRERGAQKGPRRTQRGQKRDATRGADSAMGATRCKKSLQKAAAWPLRSLSVCLSVWGPRDALGRLPTMATGPKHTQQGLLPSPARDFLVACCCWCTRCASPKCERRRRAKNTSTRVRGSGD